MKNILYGAFFAASIIAAALIFMTPHIVKGDEVTVSASVTTSVTCSTATTTTSFGTLNVSSVFTSVPNVTSTLSCNSGLGCTLNINDTGSGSSPGLWNASASHLIASAGATLAAGTEGYGIQATSTGAGSGGNLSISNSYNKSGNVVGALVRTATELASSTQPISGRQVVVTHKAAISEMTAAGSYTDTITYSCTGN